MQRIWKSQEYAETVADALKVLGKKNLVLVIHDQSYPQLDGEDTGRGSPYSSGGKTFIEFLKNLGFNGIQFGPQGQVTFENPSPYDSTAFSKNVLSIALGPLVWDPEWAGLLSEKAFDKVVSSKPERSSKWVQHKYLFIAQQQALREAFYKFIKKGQRLEENQSLSDEDHYVVALIQRFRRFKAENKNWLENNALFDVLAAKHRNSNWKLWPNCLDRHLLSNKRLSLDQVRRRKQKIEKDYSQQMEFYRFCQFIVHAQHETLRCLAKSLNLKLFGDLQIGYSSADEWAYQMVFLKNYRMGAPPSRTSPDGQPWNYPVINPLKYTKKISGLGPGLQLLAERLQKMFKEFDGLRIDHPHGLVCPWVYRIDPAYHRRDCFDAVQNGARLFSSPDISEHPELAEFAIARPEQINTSVARYADDWVVDLEPEQVDKYSTVVDLILESIKKAGCCKSDVLLEVLSTLPFPLRKVMEKYNVGRFRVTQKADVANLKDVYRSENAKPQDWIMVGNHDTKPIWLVAEEWHDSGQNFARAAYLAERLIDDHQKQSVFTGKMAEDPCLLAQAQFADLFASPAENISVFMSDLLGLKDIYNIPGIMDDKNWRLRVPADYEQIYLQRLSKNKALNIPHALAMAIRAKRPKKSADTDNLLKKLDNLAKIFKKK
jgi:4-alpha-glucanotransferase